MNKKERNQSVEVLAIGTELLLGNIVNSNAKWLAEQLALIGLSHYRQSVVGDNIERIKEIILGSSIIFSIYLANFRSFGSLLIILMAILFLLSYFLCD